MSIYICTIQLPENVWEERTIISLQEKDSSIFNWTTKELDTYFAGEFGWRKLSDFGICAIQYVNRTQVRLMIRSCTEDVARSMAKSFAWHVDAKKEHKRRYSRRCSNIKLMAAGNATASRHMIPA
jgi:hypothetical protein